MGKLSGGKWRYCRAALYKNHTIKTNTVIVGGKEEAHSEGDYYIAHDGKWINVGPNALDAQRQQHRLLAGGTTVSVPEPETGKFKFVTIPSVQPQGPVADRRKKIKDETTRYLEDMVASKRPAKSVRMNRTCLNGFSEGTKPYCDELMRPVHQTGRQARTKGSDMVSIEQEQGPCNQPRTLHARDVPGENLDSG
jgi:hypothetical protein